VTELRQIERALKLRIERKQVGQNSFVPPPRNRESELASRTLTALPGEIFT
jgi:hypothetical protein